MYGAREGITEEQLNMAREMQDINCIAEFFKNAPLLTDEDNSMCELSGIERILHARNRLGEIAKENGQYRLAKKNFLICARQDYAPSIYNYALLCYEGIGKHKNKETAAILFELAARKGEPRALAKLSEMYMEGYWVEQSFRKAYLCAEVAADYCPEGKYMLARCFKEGISVTPDRNKGIALWLKAAEDEGREL